MRRLMIGLTLVSMSALIPLWVRADDRQIAQEIVQQLQKHKDTGELKGFGIDLQVEEGVVRLEGRVSTARQQRLALDTVRRVNGV
ncbi:MAG: BON domain-containing protein, partial [Pirellulaceae bacterium]|nr:BON domain-containing protein [Pirellulaceae bacterium]